LKLDFRPVGCISVGDSITINQLGILNGQLSIVSSNCVFSAAYNIYRRNGDMLRRQLQKGGLTGKVFALFSKYFIVEVLVDESRFHLCN
jgi:hypothetical protein